MLQLLYIVEEWSMKDIAERFGCSAQTICNKLRTLGIETRKGHHTNRTKQKLSAMTSGANHCFYGKKRPEHSAAMKGIPRGPVSAETRKKMSAAKNGLWGGVYIGETHPRWKPASQRKQPLYKQIRSSSHMQEWRAAVFTRDDFTCVICKVRGGTLNADHIKQFAIILKDNNVKTLEEAILCPELWELENGRTLCETCHRNTDTFAKRVN